MNQEYLEPTVNYVKRTLADAEAGHDWWHIYRVWQLARKIGEREKANLLVVELAALLHDIADWKFNEGDATASGRKTNEWLNGLGLEQQVTAEVIKAINEVTFKGAGVTEKPSTLEGMVVQDADRLDALGAIGIARAFSYGGHALRPMYDPDQKPILHQDFEAYKKSQSTTINHFYEKLLLLKDRMNTPTGQQMAIERHRFMKLYLDQFYKEWSGEC